MGTMLLFLLGLCSIASPHDLKKATVHHRAPVHSSRTSRDLSRSRTGSSRTSAEAESDAEPEIPLDLPRLAPRSTYTFAPAFRIATSHTLTTVGLLPQPPPALQALRMVCISCSPQDDPSIVSTLSFRPDLGRAPPLA
jgi:hypothetical protein